MIIFYNGMNGYSRWENLGLNALVWILTVMIFICYIPVRFILWGWEKLKR